jgi:hypothetical protein
MVKGSVKDYREQVTIPWEYKGLGFWRSLWLSWVEIIVSPKEFFSRMPRNMAVAAPFFFFIVCFCIYFTSQVLLSFLRPESDISGTIRDELVIGFPVLLATVFLTSFILYFFLRLFRVKDAWKNVFRVVCYVDSAILPFGIVPFLGMPVGVIWGLGLIIIAVRQVFKVSLLKAILACLFSLLVFIGFLTGAFVLLFRVAGLRLPVFMPGR